MIEMGDGESQERESGIAVEEIMASLNSSVFLLVAKAFLELSSNITMQYYSFREPSTMPGWVTDLTSNVESRP